MTDYIEESLKYTRRLFDFASKTTEKALVYQEIESYPISTMAKLHLACGLGEIIRSE